MMQVKIGIKMWPAAAAYTQGAGGVIMFNFFGAPYLHRVVGKPTNDQYLMLVEKAAYRLGFKRDRRTSSGWRQFMQQNAENASHA